jgi:hypothetical protein
MVVITARPFSEENMKYTKKQLDMNNITPSVLVFAEPQQKTFAKEKLNLHFVLSVGDLYTDLGGSEHSIKLPDWNDNNIYIKDYSSQII